MRRRILFICTANSARSLMAEALLRELAGDQFEVASAGTEPGSPHPLALQVLEESGLSTEGLRSKPLSEVDGQSWDFVITLCEKAATECDPVHLPAQRIEWDFPDPVPANRHATFLLTFKDIKERVELFALVLQKEIGRPMATYEPVVVFKAMADDFRLAALLLIRREQQLCVCELTAAFDAPQPKVSRHLGILRDAGFLDAERKGQWIYYSLSPLIPQWLVGVLNETADHNASLIQEPAQRLSDMSDRPSVQCL